ncbi:MAG: GNAT family N-acetyltransferase [Spirochaetaceae bacterium]|nr:GNAT family N-acetyltransferase [Spirochaetaceae bacterium]
MVRIYVDSWNASFGELLSQADRTVTPDLVARWRRDLSRPVPHRWWVAEAFGSIVGCAGIGPSRDPGDPSIGELDSIFVDEPHWRTGVGRALIAVAHRHLARDGYRVAILWTVAGYRQGIDFYQAMGWRRDGGIRDQGRQIRLRRAIEPQRQ